MAFNPVTSNQLHANGDGTITNLDIAFGPSADQKSGTGIYGDGDEIHICVNGVDQVTIDSLGLHGTVVGTITRADNLSGGLGGSIPYQSAVNTTAMLANGSAGQYLASQGTTVAPHWISPPSSIANLSGGLGGQIPYQSAVNTTALLANGSAGQVLTSQGTTLAPQWVTPAASFNILAFSSTATVGGAATEAVTVTGLLSSDTIIAVSQKTPGGAALPLTGFSTQINNGLTLIYSADMGSGAIVLVSVKR